MILPENVVEVFVLSHQDVNLGVSLDAFNGGCVRAALVNGDLLWDIVKVDGALQKSSRCCHVLLGSEQKVQCISSAINSQIQAFPLTSYLDIGLVHTPTPANWTFAFAKETAASTSNILMAQRCTVVWSTNTPRSCIIFLTWRRLKRVGHVPAQAHEYDFQWIVKPFENLTQGAIDQTFTEIMHGPDGRLCLMQQKRFECIAILQI